jgi:hypothetical protein
MRSRARRAFGAAAGLELAWPSQRRILVQWGLKLLLPLQDAGARGSVLRLGDVTRMLQRDGERSVRQRVIGSEESEDHRSRHGLIELAGVAQGANQPVVGLNVRRVGSQGGAKGIRSLRGLAAGEQILAELGERVGGVRIGHGWF